METPIWCQQTPLALSCHCHKRPLMGPGTVRTGHLTTWFADFMGSQSGELKCKNTHQELSFFREGNEPTDYLTLQKISKLIVVQSRFRWSENGDPPGRGGIATYRDLKMLHVGNRSQSHTWNFEGQSEPKTHQKTSKHIKKQKQEGMGWLVWKSRGLRNKNMGYPQATGFGRHFENTSVKKDLQQTFFQREIFNWSFPGVFSNISLCGYSAAQ